MTNGLKSDLGPLRALWDGGTLAGEDDGALLSRFVEGGSGLAFEVLIRRHGPMVLRVCSQLLGDRHAAEDAFQAVFVVLARRARSIRHPERLAPWLHGVALRTAKESRSREARRRRIERRGATMQPTTPGPPEHPLIRAEEAEALHVEIARLPERYRGPVVLCDLQGLTQQEAAARLRCPLGTVAIRLKRARERLRARLIRRGLDPAAGLMLANPGPATSPFLPPALIEATVHASTAAGPATASVVSLAQGVQMTMTIAKIKMATAVAVLALGLAATWIVAGGFQVLAPPQVERKDGPPPVVPLRRVEKAVLREVRDYEDYLGRAEPSRTVEIRARVAGILETALVADGAKIKAKDILFEIDPKHYQAALKLAEARVLKTEAERRKLVKAERDQEANLAKQEGLGQQEVDRRVAEVFDGDNWATLDAKRIEGRAKGDLEATRVRAPFDGEVIRQAARPGDAAQAGHSSPMTLDKPVNPGDAIKAGETVLAKLIATDPIAVAIDLDERTVLKLRRMYGDDKAKAADDLSIRVALFDEREFSHEATLESLPDRLDPATGTGRFRATIPNPDHRILPGASARVRMTAGPPLEALLVPDSAIMVGPHASVYVVDARDVIEERVVKIGQSHGDLRVIREGLKPGERVLASDLRGVRPGTTLEAPAAPPANP